MVHGYVVTSILLCFLFAPCYHSLGEAIDGGPNLLNNEKNATLSVPRPFLLSPGAKFTNSGGNTISHKDTISAGCYNLHCAGFVPAKGAALMPGQAVAPSSIYDEADHYVRLSLNEDPNSGDWVLYRHDLDKPSFLGNFSREFCPTRSRIQALTGFVNYLNTTTGMGSGHFPDKDVKRSAYFKHVKMYDSKGHAWDPHTTRVFDVVDRADCYNATGLLVDFNNKGYTFYYGGPSGCVG
uniref:Uncharacterized protein n=1 Tax=Avena sativa TaxID=4498 RepID=A0ACD5ZAR5_AVESA